MAKKKDKNVPSLPIENSSEVPQSNPASSKSIETEEVVSTLQIDTDGVEDDSDSNASNDETDENTTQVGSLSAESQDTHGSVVEVPSPLGA